MLYDVLGASKKSNASKAKAAANASNVGKFAKKNVKVRTKVSFRRKHTLRLSRTPLFPRKAVPGRNKLDSYAIVKFPLTTEAAMKKIEENNTLTFIVDVRAAKEKIKAAINDLYSVNVHRINTLVRPDGQKKAYVRLSPDVEALEIANRIGII